MTTMFFIHLWLRLRAATRDPFALVLLLFAGLSSLLLWPWLLTPDNTGTAKGLTDLRTDPFLLLPYLCFWPVLVLLAQARVSLGRSIGDEVRSRPMPGLPIGTRSRIVAEVLACVILTLFARASLLLLSAWPRVSDGLFLLTPAGATSARLAFLVNTGLDALILFPVLLAWASSARLGWVAVLKPAGVVTLLFIGMTSGWLLDPRIAVMASVALSFAVLAVPDIAPITRKMRVGRWKPGALVRAPRVPEAQFRRDQWLGPLRVLWPLLTVIATATLGGLALDATIGLQDEGRGLLYTLPFFVLLTVFFYPIGVRLLPRRSLGGSVLLSGYYLSAWAVLPVKRETVARGVYLHGLLGGLLLWAFVALHTSVLIALKVREVEVIKLLLISLPVLLLVSGFLICSAAGDKGRGAIVILAILLVYASGPLSIYGGGALWGVWGLNHAWVLDLSAVTVLAIAGGLPPLVHLRSARPEATR